MNKRILACLLIFIMCFTLTACGSDNNGVKPEASGFIEGWNVELTDDEVLKMSNFMASGSFIIVNNNLYGTFGGENYGEGNFSVAKIKNGNKVELEETKVITENAYASYLCEYKDNIYAILDNEKIVKIKDGDNKAETLYTGSCEFLQIFDSKLYFTDDEHKLCSIDLDGKNKSTVIDKKDIYYTYIINEEWLIYQDDPDNESLHMYNMKSNSDYKLNDEVAYSPIIKGNYIYYINKKSSGEDYNLNRLDLISGEIETESEYPYAGDIFIEKNKIAFTAGGLPELNIDEWNNLINVEHGGYIYYPRYSNGKIRVICDDYGEAYILNKAFGENYENTTKLGYFTISK